MSKEKETEEGQMRKEKEEGKEVNRRRSYIAGVLATAAMVVPCVAASSASAVPPFDPSITSSITTSAANSPTGLNFVLELPQSDDPDGIATSHLKKGVVELPDGMTLDPSAANGLTSCSLAQIKLKSNLVDECPNSSSIGTVTVTTPLLDESLQGNVHLATPFDNPFNSLFAIYFVIDNAERGIRIKLAGRTDVDSTGKITTTFDDQPQLPFDHLYVNLHTPNGGPLSSPDCGTHSVKATFYPWARPNTPSALTAPFSVNTNCGATRIGGLSLAASEILPKRLRAKGKRAVSKRKAKAKAKARKRRAAR
jgi:hypothetical protein